MGMKNKNWKIEKFEKSYNRNYAIKFAKSQYNNQTKILKNHATKIKIEFKKKIQNTKRLK